ncbi:MAG: helix-turn-helix domain-containing protein [Christensenellaceae bacterium]|jgi:hypothetical protein|uniref:helix-turn-helix domain-containing protein n=2 Tax=Rikenellaceae TaxID=171550 RepID=UPI002430B8B5|nr:MULTISPECIES: helix-turn-helix domain-containing protein [Alistipes]
MDSMSSDYLTTEKEEVKRIYDYIAQIEKAIRISMQKFKPSICDERYLSGEEVCELLQISSRTLQTFRDTGHITYIEVSGRTFLYPESALNDLLNKNLHPAQI